MLCNTSALLFFQEQTEENLQIFDLFPNSKFAQNCAQENSAYAYIALKSDYDVDYFGNAEPEMFTFRRPVRDIMDSGTGQR